MDKDDGMCVLLVKCISNWNKKIKIYKKWKDVRFVKLL